jgi:nucleoside phosphorylase
LPVLQKPVSNMDSSTTLTHRDYTVGWICALPAEMAAARGMLDQYHNPLEQDPHDQNNYALGCIGLHNVVLACLPDGVTGLTSAAAVAIQMSASFRWLRFGLMVGIGGGVPSQDHDIRLGDVVVSKPSGTFGGVIQYDFGKTVQEGKFTRTGSLNRPPDVLLTALANLQAKHLMEDPELLRHITEMVRKYPKMRPQFTHPGRQKDQQYEAAYDHQGDNVTCGHCDTSRLVDREARSSDAPIIHYGLIASGNQVMKHGDTRDQLRRELDVLCFEMEAAGLTDRFPCLVIRGICDYADSHKNKQWQKYAAATAAAYAKELLSVVPAKQVMCAPPVAEVTIEGTSISQVPP